MAGASERGLAAIVGRAAVVLIGIAAIATLSAFFDARLAAGALGLPPQAVVWGRFISEIGTANYMYAVATVLAAVALLLRRMMAFRHGAAFTLLAERAAYVVATLAAEQLAAQLIKHLVGRARPRLFETFGPYHFDVLSMEDALASFPSGHATTAFAMAVGLSLMMPRLRVALFTMAIAIATSRIVVQAHYASDIAAGSVLGTGMALLMARLFADRGMAFERRDGRLVVKGAGSIAAALRGQPPLP